MKTAPDIKHGWSVDWLKAQLQQFLKNNPCLTPEGLGWKAVGDPSMVVRVLAGGDVTTSTMDRIIHYLTHLEQKEKRCNPNKKPKKKGAN